MKPVNDTLKAVALFAAVFALAELGLLFREAAGVIRETKLFIAETDRRLDGTFRNLNAIVIQTGLVTAPIEELSRNMDSAATRQGKYWEALQAMLFPAMVTGRCSIRSASKSTAPSGDSNYSKNCAANFRIISGKGWR